MSGQWWTETLAVVCVQARSGPFMEWGVTPVTTREWQAEACDQGMAGFHDVDGSFVINDDGDDINDNGDGDEVHALFDILQCLDAILINLHL